MHTEEAKRIQRRIRDAKSQSALDAALKDWKDYCTGPKNIHLFEKRNKPS